MTSRERTGVFCLNKNRLLTIELKDPVTKKRFWSLPGGGVEAGETPAEAAIRETLEETGYEVALTSDGFATHYDFYWNAEVYQCTTWWFSARLITDTPMKVDDADYLIQAKWLAWPGCRVLFDNRPAFAGMLDHFIDTT